MEIEIETELKKKICKKCGNEKEIKLFATDHNKNRKTFGKATNICKTCENKRKHSLPGRKRRKKENQLFLFNYLLDKSCKDCSNNNILTLQFDHIIELYPKKYEISEIIKKGTSLDTVKKEIDKCEIVCANCHTIRTMKRGNHSRYKLAIEKGIIVES